MLAKGVTVEHPSDSARSDNFLLLLSQKTKFRIVLCVIMIVHFIEIEIVISIGLSRSLG